jgi:hypothetical protein
MGLRALRILPVFIVHSSGSLPDHIIAKQHGGSDELHNLALACIHCNRYKGPNIAGMGPDTGELTRLFHPRSDDCHRHFAWKGAEIQRFRVTVQVNTYPVLGLEAD